MAGQTSLIIFFCFGSLCASCDRSPNFIAHEPGTPQSQSPYNNMASIPIILVGRITSDAEVGHPQRAAWNPYEMLQLRCVKVVIENVLRGSLKADEVSVYYFVQAGPIHGPPRLGRWQVADRDMFFVRQELGEVRTVCDFSAGVPAAIDE